MSSTHISSITGTEYNFSDNFVGTGGVTTDDLVDCDIPSLNPKPFPIFPSVDNMPQPDCCTHSPISLMGSSVPFATGGSESPGPPGNENRIFSKTVLEKDFCWWVWCAGSSVNNTKAAGTWVLASGDTTKTDFATPPAYSGKYYGEVIAVYAGSQLNDFNVGQNALIYIEENVPLFRNCVIDNTNEKDVAWRSSEKLVTTDNTFLVEDDKLTLIVENDFCLYTANVKNEDEQIAPIYVNPQQNTFNVIDLEFTYKISNEMFQSVLSLGFFVKQNENIYALTLDTTAAHTFRRYIGSGLTAESFKRIQTKQENVSLDFSRTGAAMTFGFFCTIAGDIIEPAKLQIADLKLFVGL